MKFELLVLLTYMHILDTRRENLQGTLFFILGVCERIFRVCKGQQNLDVPSSLLFTKKQKKQEEDSAQS